MISKKKKALKPNASARACAWYVGSNVISRGAAFAFTPIFTRLLSPREFGVFSLYMSLMGIFSVLTTLEISGGVMYRGLVKFDGERQRSFIASAVFAEMTVSALSLAVYLLFKRFINGATSLNTAFSTILILQVFVNSATSIYFAKKRFSGQHARISLINITNGIGAPLCAILLINLGVSVGARIYASFAVSAIFAIPIIISLTRGASPFKEGWRFIFSFSLPMLPHHLASSLITHGEKIIIARTIGETALGKYSLAYSVGFIPSLITSGFSLVLTPWIMKRLREENISTVSQTLLSVTRLISVAILVFMSVAPNIFKFLASREFYPALSAVYPIAVSVIFSFLSSAMTSCLLYYEKPKTITKNSVLCAAASIISSIFFTRIFGYVGTAYSVLLSSILLFLLNLRSTHKISEGGIFVLKGLGYPFLVFTLLAVMTYILRQSDLARSLVFCALILIILGEGKRCKRLIF